MRTVARATCSPVSESPPSKARPSKAPPSKARPSKARPSKAPLPDEPAAAATPVRPAVALLGILLYVACAALAATIEVLLIPFRIGTVLVPLCVLLGAATNIALPLLVRQIVASALAATAPVVGWFATVAILAGSRPEGDVLVPGGARYQSLSYVFVALALAGIAAGVTTILRGERRRPAPSSVRDRSDRPSRPSRRR